MNPDALLERIEHKHPWEIHRDDTNYLAIISALEHAKMAVGCAKLNERNETTLSSMWEDIHHMLAEVNNLRDQQQRDPYELV